MISQVEYQQRRQRLFAQMSPNSIAVFPTSPEYHRSADQLYPFYPDNDFYYLTGFPEPEAIAVLIKDDKLGELYYLFNRPSDAEAEVWVGARIGHESAKQDYLANESYAIEDLQRHLPDLLQDKDKLYYTFGRYQATDACIHACINQVRNHVRGGVKIPDTVVNAENMLFEMRLIKSDAELELMRTASKISAAAHVRAMKACQPGMYEYELEAELIYEFHKGGCEGEAYSSIVGSAENACVLHYEENNRQMNDGDLVLIDAAGKYHNYCSDITRTFPVNGKYTPEQRDIYDIVLASQLKAIETIKPGARWSDMRDAAARVITQGLVDLKILKGCVDTLLEQEAFRPYYMHRIGHWIGMDVHDVGRYKVEGDWRKFEVGMVTTVEPGIYIRPESKGVHKRWWGIGVRVEDDVAVTEKGHEVFTSGVPKTMDEIEALMAS